MGIFFKSYATLFSRRFLIKLHKILYQLSLRGMGILNSQNDYLSGEKFWLRKHLDKSKPIIILDVGANVGNYSKKILRINPNAKIFAFEPHPFSFEQLKRNIHSSNFKPFNLGVGDKKEKLLLYDYQSEKSTELASLYKPAIEDLRNTKSQSFEIEIIRLDDFLREQEIDQIDLLKIDTEGNEFKVLLGAKEYLLNNRIKTIQFEFNEINIFSRTFFKDFWDLLPNYNFYRLMPGGKLFHIKKYNPATCEIFAFQNIIATLKSN